MTYSIPLNAVHGDINFSNRELQKDTDLGVHSESPVTIDINSSTIKGRLFIYTGMSTKQAELQLQKEVQRTDEMKRVNIDLKRVFERIIPRLPSYRLKLRNERNVENLSIGKGSVLKVSGGVVKNISIGMNSRVYLYEGVEADGLTVGDNAFLYCKGRACLTNMTIGNYATSTTLILDINEKLDEQEQHFLKKRNKYYVDKQNQVNEATLA